MKPRSTPVICTMLILSGCVSAPRETVELTEIVDRQITEMQASHEKFVRLYYDKLRDEVDSFLEQRWIPQLLVNIVEGSGENSKQFRTDLDNAYRLAAMDWEKTIGIAGIQDETVKQVIRDALRQLTSREKTTLGMVLLDFSRGVQAQINERRKSLVRPIDQQEAYVLDQLRVAYADLQRGTWAIKAHLASVVKLVEQRDATLEKLGVLERQKRIMATAIELNEGAVDALKGVGQAQEGVKTFVESMERTLKELESLSDSGR